MKRKKKRKKIEVIVHVNHFRSRVDGHHKFFRAQRLLAFDGVNYVHQRNMFVKIVLLRHLEGQEA